MSAVGDRLASAGRALPAPAASLGLYAPAVRSGAFVYTSGQLPFRDGALLTSGLVGDEVDADHAASCAEQAALNALAAASSVCDLDGVRRVVKLTVYVASAPGFRSQPAVADGASRVLVEAFGDDAGRCARAAVGVSELPLGAPVEVDLVMALD